MSFILECTKQTWAQEIRETSFSREVPSPLIYSRKRDGFLIGDVFLEGRQDVEAVFASGWEERPERLLDFKGSFSIVRAAGDKLFFASGMGGIEKLFYYHKKGVFYLSDNIWNIIDRVSPGFEDVDREALREMVFYGGLFFGHTFIRNCHVLLPQTLAVYDIKSDTIKTAEYFNYCYHADPALSLGGAVERMDRLFDDTMKEIKRSFKEGTRFAVALSGGLDSRIIPHYAKKNGMRLSGYLFCKKRPHKIFLSKDVANSRKIARAYGIPCREVEWSGNALEERIRLNLKNNPFSPEFMLYQDQGIPEFDVLLTGASGYIVGGAFGNPRLGELIEAELEKEMRRLCPILKADPHMSDRVKWAFEYLFHKPARGGKKKKILPRGLIKREEEERFRKKMREFIRERKERGNDNISIFQDWFQNRLGFWNRMGAYESHIGTKRSISIYMPFFVEECFNWPGEYIIDRIALKELLHQKIREVSMIPPQNYQLPYGEKGFLPLKKIYWLLDYWLRGNGNAGKIYNFKDRRCRKKCREDFSRTSEWFDRIFSVQDILPHIWRSYTLLSENLWFAKRLLEVLETKDYKEFTDGIYNENQYD